MQEIIERQNKAREKREELATTVKIQEQQDFLPRNPILQNVERAATALESKQVVRSTSQTNVRPRGTIRPQGEELPAQAVRFKEEQQSQRAQDLQIQGISEGASRLMAAEEDLVRQADSTRGAKRAGLLAVAAGAGIAGDTARVVEQPLDVGREILFGAASLGQRLRQDGFKETAKDLGQQFLDAGARNPIEITAVAAANMGFVAQSVSKGGRKAGQAAANRLDDFTEFNAELLDDRTAALRGSSKRKTTKAELRKRSRGQASNPNEFMQDGKAGVKSGRAARDRDIVYAVDEETIRFTQQKDSAKTGLGRDRATVTTDIRNAQVVNREFTFEKVKGSAKQSTPRKDFKRPPSQVSSPNTDFEAVAELVYGRQTKKGFSGRKKSKDPNIKQESVTRNPQAPQVLDQPINPSKKKSNNKVVISNNRGLRVASPREQRFLQFKQELSQRARLRQRRLSESKPQEFTPTVNRPEFFTTADQLIQANKLQAQLDFIPAVPKVNQKLPIISLSTTRTSQVSDVALNELLDQQEKQDSKPAVVVIEASALDIDTSAAVSQDLGAAQVSGVAQDVAETPAFDTDTVTVPRRRRGRPSEKPVNDIPETPITRVPPPPPKTPPPKTPPEIRVPVVPRRPRTPENPRTPIRPLLDDNSKPKKQKQLFRVVVGARGNKVFRDLGAGGLDLIRRGRDLVKSTAAASVRVIPLGASSIPRGLFDRTFRRSKKDAFTFVEKKEERISSEGEKGEITQLGILTSKKQRKKKKRKKSGSKLTL